MMMALLLRTLTEKSIIGFGNYKSLTVADLLSMRHYKELISLYYNCDRITFCPEVMEVLLLNDPERAIQKPGKSKVHYDKYAKSLVWNIEGLNGVEWGKPVDNGNSRNLLNPNPRKQFIRGVKEQSKMLNRNRVQNKTS